MKGYIKHLQLCGIVINIWGTCVVAGISVVVTECFMVCKYVVDVFMIVIIQTHNQLLQV